MNQANTPFSSFIAELRQLCREQRTGTLYVAIDKNHLAQLSLERGEIVFLFFQGKRGADALPLILSISACRSRFAEGLVPAFRTSLPSTDEILRYLVAGDRQAGHAVLTGTKPALKITEQAKITLEKALAEYIGPMAAIVCAEHFEKVHDLESAVEALAREIPKSKQASRFRENVRSKLKLSA